MALQELAERSAHGITVCLWWESEADEISVTYIDEQTGDAFAVFPPREKAMDAFIHPNAYPRNAWDLRLAMNSSG
jgi:hypothetical protein